MIDAINDSDASYALFVNLKARPEFEKVELSAYLKEKSPSEGNTEGRKRKRKHGKKGGKGGNKKQKTH